MVTNPKRTLRLWRARCLQRPPQRRQKRQRLGDGTAVKLRAEHPNHVWALDFQSDETAARRRLKPLNVTDEFTREALAIHVDHSSNADKVIEVVESIAAVTGAPQHLRMDSGPELVAATLGTGASSQAPTPPTSSTARRGRTATSNPSTARPTAGTILNTLTIHYGDRIADHIG